MSSSSIRATARLLPALLLLGAEQFGGERALGAAVGLNVLSDDDRVALVDLPADDLRLHPVAQADADLQRPDEAAILHPEKAAVVGLLLRRRRRAVGPGLAPP